MYDLAVVRATGHEHLGYGTFGLNLVNGLRDIGVRVRDNDTIQDLTPPPTHETVVYCAVPGWCPGRYPGQKIVLFSMWEASHIPPLFADRLHNYDLICVPNESNVQQFSQYNPNTTKINLGYDSTTWKYKRRGTGDTFNILFCGAGAVEKTRKGSDVAITAFQEAFPKWQSMNPSPRLIIKCLDCPPSNVPPFVKLHVGQWSVEKLRDLYWSCHGAIIPSRGEGWGYFPMQALATGMPTILSRIPGHQEFMELPGFLPIETDPRPALEFVYGDSGDWCEPRIDDTKTQLQRLYGDYTALSGEALIGSRSLEQYHDHRAMARKLISVIDPEWLKLRSPVGDQDGTQPDRITKFTELQFLLRTNRALGPDECSIAGTRYLFLPDTEYWVPANVCHVLERAGYRANKGEERWRMIE